MSKWKKGESGNPNGRPKGTVLQSTRIRELLESHADALVQKAVELALEGDVGALKLCFDRVCPPLKPKEEFAGLDTIGKCFDSMDDFLLLLSSGQITPSEAKTIIHSRIEQLKLEKMIEEKNDPLKQFWL